METIIVGPLAFPTRPILLLAAVVTAFFVGGRVAKRRGADVERALWMILFVGLGSARLAFVLIYWRSYTERPWTAFDIRDGGMNAAVGIVGAVVMAVFLAARNHAWRQPLLASLLSGVALWGGMTAAMEAGRPATSVPSFALPNLEGGDLALESLIGKPVIINLWASWCPPCRREMPVLEEAQKAHRDVVFVFANQGEPLEAVRTYIDSKALQLDNVLLDTAGAVAKHAGVAGLPTTLFFDRHGKLVDTRIGEVSKASLEQRIEQLRRP